MLENKTREKIYNVAFKLFLENGYEATNIRDICKEIGIKSSTIYFYYKSKQELFFKLYDQTIQDYLDHIRCMTGFGPDILIEEKLYTLLKNKIEYYASDISKRKFILRYHLFPPEEISNLIRDKYKLFTSEENRIILEIIENSQDSNLLSNGIINGFLLEYRRLESYLVYEMILSSTKLSNKELRTMWVLFWNKVTM